MTEFLEKSLKSGNNPCGNFMSVSELRDENPEKKTLIGVSLEIPVGDIS